MTDSVVVPSELAADFEYVNGNLRNEDYIDSGEVLRSWSLERRRALVYAFSDGLHTSDVYPYTLVVVTFPSAENELDKTIGDMAEQLGFSISEKQFLPTAGNITYYYLVRESEMKLGEIVWYADWIVTNHSEIIKYAHHDALLSPGS